MGKWPIIGFKIMRMALSTKTRILNKSRELFKVPLFEKMLRKAVSGKSSNSLIGKLVPNNYQYPKGSIRRFHHKGIQFELDIHDYIGHLLYFGFKDDGQQELVDFAEEGDVFLDVGTNIGSSLLQFAKNVGKTGRVYGFEPDQLNFQQCQNNIRLNNFDNVQVSNIALGNKSSKVKLVVDTESNRGGNRILDEANGKDYTEVEVVPLDEWVEQQLISAIDFIKIDVEGFELNVLQGATESLKKFSPRLFIELDDENLKLQGQSAKELVVFLNEMGYCTYQSITKQTVNPKDNFANCHYDIIAVKNKGK